MAQAVEPERDQADRVREPGGGERAPGNAPGEQHEADREQRPVQPARVVGVGQQRERAAEPDRAREQPPCAARPDVRHEEDERDREGKDARVERHPAELEEPGRQARAHRRRHADPGPRAAVPDQADERDRREDEHGGPRVRHRRSRRRRRSRGQGVAERRALVVAERREQDRQARAVLVAQPVSERVARQGEGAPRRRGTRAGCAARSTAGTPPRARSPRRRRAAQAQASAPAQGTRGWLPRGLPSRSSASASSSSWTSPSTGTCRPAAPTLASNPVRSRNASLTRAASAGIDRRDAALLRPGARPAGRALGRAHREPLLDDPLGEPAAAVLVGHGEHRARMALGQLAPRDHAQHVLGQLEQPDPVRDRRLRAADALGDLAEREAELVDQHGVGTRFFDRRQVLARDVLDEAEQQRVAVVGLAHDGRDGRDPGLAGGAPAALAGDQLVAALRAAAAGRPAGSAPAP